MARYTSTQLKMIGTKIAQGAVIRNKTGNLQQNAIRARDTQGGVIIYVDDNVGPYGAILNSGKVGGKGQDWTGWWEKVRNNIAVYFNSDANARKTSLTATIEMVNANEKDTVKRQVEYLRNIRRA